MTPLINIPFDMGSCTVRAKLEYLQPSGSIKDRSAEFIINHAEQNGLLKKDGTIVEASSGNQGIACARIGALRGYHVIIVVPQKISLEKINTLRAYGAEVKLCDGGIFIEDPTNYRNVAKQISRNILGSFLPNQYFNMLNPEAYYNTLGPEIWEQSNGELTHLVAAVGTGGTISGTGRFLKEKKPSVKIIGVDVSTSYRSTGGRPTPYELEGIGVDFDTPCLDKTVVDQFVAISDKEGFRAMKKMARRGFLVGTASGAVCAALEEYILPKIPKGSRIVTIFTDSGRSYLERF